MGDTQGAVIPEELEYIPAGYEKPAEHQGKLEKLVEDAVFVFSDNERGGNLAFREREGYVHDGKASNEYTYNGLMFFWNS